VSWERPFDQPVPLPNGPSAHTLRDAANYIKRLPDSERDRPECQLAIQMLIDAAEDRGPMLFAKMGIHRAFYRNVGASPVPKPRTLVGGSRGGRDDGRIWRGRGR